MRKISVAILSSMLMLSLMGCGGNVRDGHNQNHAGHNTGTPMNMNSKGMNATDMNSPMYGKSLTTNNTADLHGKVRDHISSVKGVNDSTFLINDKDIVVGLRVENQADRARIEREVKQVLQDNHAGYNVHITSDTSFHERIRTLGEQMNAGDGQPMNNLGNDIKTLLNDIGKSVQKAGQSVERAVR